MTTTAEARSGADDVLVRAVKNNAIWCDTVCRSHGRTSSTSADVWVCPEPMPPFYPNVISLTGVEHVAMQRATIAALVASGLPRPWAVKDSYATLDLAPLGFQILFDATWLSRPAGLAVPTQAPSGASWERVRTPEGLGEWEAAWSDGQEALVGRIFLPGLIADPAVAVLAARRDGHVIAGAIANRGGGVVGISNCFVRAEGTTGLQVEALATAMSAFPDTPLVGYERGSDLVAMHGLGFVALGPLRVWELGTT